MSKIINNSVRKIALYMIQDLENGNTTMSGNQTTDYYVLCITEDGKTLSVAMIHEIKDVSTPYFTIHVVDDINELDGELFTTEHDSLSELYELLESIQKSTIETYLKEREEEPEQKAEPEFEKCLNLLVEPLPECGYSGKYQGSRGTLTSRMFTDREAPQNHKEDNNA